jgi:cytochrome c-type biogenesis protein CcsB
VSAEAWAQVSNALVYSTIIVLAVALVAFAADLAAGTGRRRASEAQQRQIAERRAAAGGSGAVSVAVAASDDDTRHDRWARVGVSLTTLAALLSVGAVLARGLAAQRPPWGNMYEFTVTSVAVLLVIWVAMLPRRPEWRDLGVLVVLFNLLLLGVAVLVLYTESAELIPALKSYWLWIHVSAAIIASAVFTVGSLASILYLLREGYERRAASGGLGGQRPAGWRQIGWVARSVSDAVGARLPESGQLDRVAYQTIAFAFPLWFFAVVAGAIWAEDAWGRYWGWDPKETWAFITWVVYAAYLHARSTAGWRGSRASWIAIAGWVAFMINYFGVNFFASGLHSYAGV